MLVVIIAEKISLLIQSSSSMLCSRRGPLRRSYSMVTADAGWHAYRVPLVNCSSPVESGRCGSTRASSPVRTRRTTNRCACRAPCAQERHSQAGQCVQKPRCDGPPGFRPTATRSVRACTSTLLTKSDQRIASI